jgi:hypothetical protein
MYPAKPDIEFTSIKITDTAATVLVGAHFLQIIHGVRKIPPPVPVKPANRPRTPPVTKREDRFGS